MNEARRSAAGTLQLLALTTSYPLRQGSAAGVFVRRLYENFPADWSVTVLCPDDAGQQDGLDGQVGVQPVRYAPKRWQTLSQNAGGILPMLRADPRKLLLVPLLLGSLLLHCLRAARRADVIHANWSICGVLAVIAGKVCRRPVVTTLRGDDVAGAGRLSRLLLAIAVRGSAAIVCVSDAMAATLRQRYPQHADRIHVCRNGVEEAFLQVVGSHPIAGKLRIVAVGSLVQRKGIDVLLRAMALAVSRDHISLRVVGEGPELEALRAQAAELGLAGQVEFAGGLPPDAVPGFLAQADVFVLASRSEGRPNVVVEALAAGLPVISTNLPGVEGLVVPGSNGWLVPIDDAASMAQALDDAHGDPARRAALARNARDGALARETWGETARRYDLLFRRMIHSINGSQA